MKWIHFIGVKKLIAPLEVLPLKLRVEWSWAQLGSSCGKSLEPPVEHRLHSLHFVEPSVNTPIVTSTLTYLRIVPPSPSIMYYSPSSGFKPANMNLCFLPLKRFLTWSHALPTSLLGSCAQHDVFIPVVWGSCDSTLLLSFCFCSTLLKLCLTWHISFLLQSHCLLCSTHSQETHEMDKQPISCQISFR